MKKKIIYFLYIILFIVVLLFINRIVNEPIEKHGNNINIEDVEISKENVDMNVLNITSANFESEVLKSGKTVLIDFYADWCGPCKMLSPIVENIASENSNIKVCKINIDNEQDIAVEYGVLSIPTLVVIKNGEEVNRTVGVVSKTEILDLIK